MSSTFRAFLNHPAGPKTIHFWAPIFKWGLVVAGINDFKRPASQLSLRQSGSLSLTGFVWARYSTQIIPVNWSLFAVNFFLGITGLIQVGRVMIYRYQGEPHNQELSEN
jgi:hypothetical protein